MPISRIEPMSNRIPRRALLGRAVPGAGADAGGGGGVAVVVMGCPSVRSGPPLVRRGRGKVAVRRARWGSRRRPAVFVLQVPPRRSYPAAGGAVGCGGQRGGVREGDVVGDSRGVW